MCASWKLEGGEMLGWEYNCECEKTVTTYTYTSESTTTSAKIESTKTTFLTFFDSLSFIQGGSDISGTLSKLNCHIKKILF
jgi:hypothetical protein